MSLTETNRSFTNPLVAFLLLLLGLIFLCKMGYSVNVFCTYTSVKISQVLHFKVQAKSAYLYADISHANINSFDARCVRRTTIYDLHSCHSPAVYLIH